MLGRGLNFYASFKNKGPGKGACDISRSGKVAKIEIFNLKDQNEPDFGPHEFLYVNIESD